MKRNLALGIFILGSIGTGIRGHPNLADWQRHSREDDYTDPSTELIGDLATDGATTAAGETIQAILERRATARVDTEKRTRRRRGTERTQLPTRSGQVLHLEPHCGSDDAGIPDMVDRRRQQCTSLARSALRMGFHDAGVWNTSMEPVAEEQLARGVGAGGADGSILLTPGEFSRLENHGLEDIGQLMMSWYDIYHASHGVSMADLIQMGALVALTACPGGPRVRAFVGRYDVDGSVPLAPAGMLPSPSFDASRVRDMFAAKTLSPTDLVALVGAHTVSRQYFVDKTQAGLPQDTTEGI